MSFETFWTGRSSLTWRLCGRTAHWIADPDDPYRSLQERYGKDTPITDADVRIILTIRPEAFVTVRNGKVVSG